MINAISHSSPFQNPLYLTLAKNYPFSEHLSSYYAVSAILGNLAWLREVSYRMGEKVTKRLFKQHFLCRLILPLPDPGNCPMSFTRRLPLQSFSNINFFSHKIYITCSQIFVECKFNLAGQQLSFRKRIVQNDIQYRKLNTWQGKKSFCVTSYHCT